jgi:protein ImuB
MLACVHIEALPLQLLLLEHKLWREKPTATVSDDDIVTHTNRHARALGIQAGIKRQDALRRCENLRTAYVSEAKLKKLHQRLSRMLRRYSPRIDQTMAGEGVFFVDATGLERLFPALEYWTRAMAAELKHIGLVASVVLGHERETTYAIAKSMRGTAWFDDMDKEHDAALAGSPLLSAQLDLLSRPRASRPRGVYRPTAARKAG